VVELEGVEAEAAAVIYRAFGFKPTAALAECVMADRNPKMPLGVSLGGWYPLATMPQERDVEAGAVDEQTSRSNIGAKRASVDSGVGLNDDTKASLPESVLVGPGPEIAQPSRTEAAMDLMSYLRGIIGQVDEPKSIESLFGLFLFVDGMKLSKTSAYVDIESVVKSIDAIGLVRLKGALSHTERRHVLQLMCTAYNETALQVASILAAVSRMRDKGGADALRFNPRSAKYFVDMIATARCKMEMQFEELTAMCGKSYPVRALEFPADLMNQAVQSIISHAHRAFGSSMIGISEGDYLTEIRYVNGETRDVVATLEWPTPKVRVRVPKWTGIKTITYRGDTKGEVVSAKVKPGKILRALSGEKVWHYD